MDIKTFIAKLILAGSSGVGIAYILTYLLDQQLVYVISIASALAVYSILDIYFK